MRLTATTCWLLVGVIIVACGIQQVANETSPPIPVFASNYHVEGLLSLPYAELNEPFTAWFDKNSGRSRTDYYGDLYKIYQFGPQSAPEESDRKYGSMYKLAYVPADFHPRQKLAKNESLFDRALKSAKNTVRTTFSHLDRHQPKPSTSTGGGVTATRRACFAVKGGVGMTIGPQTVLPSLVDFTFDSSGRCPHISAEHRHAKCELWKMVSFVGDKKNTYKMWVTRDMATNATIPVHYYMLGYDNLLGSHYDRYDVTYYKFRAGVASDSDFKLEPQGFGCESMPGPGSDGSEAELRSHMVVQNPIHEYVIEPHRYDHIDHEFDKFTKEHQKNYNGPDHERRSWHNFLHNFRFINGKNRELKEYKLGVNRFADNNMQELRYLRGRLRSTGYNGGLDYSEHHKLLKDSNGKTIAKTPEYWDWTIRGAVTPVKDQAVCGSCWSFGTSGTLEGAYFVKTGKLPKLSQQQMVDCSWKFGNNGCDGGEDFRAYKYIMEAGGLASEEDYGQYLGVDGKCHDREVKKSVKISGFYNVTANDPEALKHAIVTYGPVTVAIDASRPTFTFYSHGVYYDDKCNRSPDGLDHQVLATGYANLDGKFVWMIKNSWSTHWGNNGYILMSAENNNCGVMDAPTVPIIQV